MLLYILIGILVGLLIGFIVYNLKKKTESTTDLATLLESKLPDAIKKASDQILILAKQQLGAEKQDIQTDLKNKKESIEKLIKQIHDELKSTNEKVEGSDRERIGSFRALKQEIESHRKVTDQLSVTTEGLKSVLSNNQLRGQFGEQVAENLLKMTGFVKGTDYVFNKAQDKGEGRPDFTVFLPDGVKINVDAKFPYNNLQKSAETNDVSAKKEYMKAFERDVKEKIKQITSREYISPENNTVDFAVLFIPNEMIFSYLYEKMHDVWEEAMKQKIIFAGPFSFTAILRLIRQSYDNFKYQKNVRKIITYIKLFEEQFGKYNEGFEKIGERIESLSKQYDEVNTTRTKQLLRTVDKIKIEESSSSQVKLLEE